MKSAIFKLLAGLTGLLLVLMLLLHYGVLPYYENKHNGVLAPGPYEVSENALRIHKNFFVADLHADPLLWGRDLSKRSSRGHIDIPRLQEGGVDLQVFGVVTKVPCKRSYDSTSDDSDCLPLVFIASWRAPSTWFSVKERALVQANELTQLAKVSNLKVVLNREDLFAA